MANPERNRLEHWPVGKITLDRDWKTSIHQPKPLSLFYGPESSLLRTGRVKNPRGFPMTQQDSSTSWIGMDESGKGDYFGPLVVAAVRVSTRQTKLLNQWGVKDSKKLTDKRAIELSDKIRKVFPHSIVSIGPEKYNTLYSKIKNLNHLLAWAHARALENLLEREETERAVADKFGDERLIQNALLKRGKKIKLEQRHRAEDDPAVAAASILARAEFLQRLGKLSRETGHNLPKGASEKVKQAALEILRKSSEEELRKVAKLHFRTTRDVLKLRESD